MNSIFSKGRIPNNLQTDKDKEFYNTTFQNLMKKYNINFYSTYSNLKASICERFNHTLKNNLWKQFSVNGNYKWLDTLPDLLRIYNNRKHRTIDIIPSEVTSTNKAVILKKLNAINRKKKQ